MKKTRSRHLIYAVVSFVIAAVFIISPVFSIYIRADVFGKTDGTAEDVHDEEAFLYKADGSDAVISPVEKDISFTEGDLTAEQLKTAVLNEKDLPAVISLEQAQKSGYVNRLYAQ